LKKQKDQNAQKFPEKFFKLLEKMLVNMSPIGYDYAIGQKHQ
tara:strand:- start:469 stop:594 length:126 start_codon:yes stop_codon:yes gene_type:complete